MSMPGPDPIHKNTGTFRSAMNTIGKLVNRAITWIRAGASNLIQRIASLFPNRVNTKQEGKTEFNASATPLSGSEKEHEIAKDRLNIQFFNPDDDEFGAVPGPQTALERALAKEQIDPELPTDDPPPPPILTESPLSHPTHYQKIPPQITPGGQAPPIPKRPDQTK